MAQRKAAPLVGVVMGSDSDWEIMRHAVAQLDAFGIPNEPRVVLDVSSFELPTSSVQPLVLGLHELTTNALKHGAFATPSGRLAVRCWMETETERPSLKLEWRESGVAMPDHDQIASAEAR